MQPWKERLKLDRARDSQAAVSFSGPPSNGLPPNVKTAGKDYQKAAIAADKAWSDYKNLEAELKVMYQNSNGLQTPETKATSKKVADAYKNWDKTNQLSKKLYASAQKLHDAYVKKQKDLKKPFYTLWGNGVRKPENNYV
jgi:hypothetical protein